MREYNLWKMEMGVGVPGKIPIKNAMIFLEKTKPQKYGAPPTKSVVNWF